MKQEDHHDEVVEQAYSGGGVEESKESMRSEDDQSGPASPCNTNLSQSIQEMENELNAPLLTLQVENLVEAHLQAIAQTTMRSLLREQLYYLTSSELNDAMLATLESNRRAKHQVEDDISFLRAEYDVLQADYNDLRRRYEALSEEMKLDPDYISHRVGKELEEKIHPIMDDAIKRLNSEEHRVSANIEDIVESATANIDNLKDSVIHDARKEVERHFDLREDLVEESWDNAINSELPRLETENEKAEWGLEFKDEGKEVYIAQIPPQSLFASSDLDVGMRVVSITSRSIPDSAVQAASALDELSNLDHCKVSVKAKGVVGTVTKMKLDSLTGMIIDDEANGVRIKQIMKGSLFAETKLKVGMRILSINSSMPPFTAVDAAKMIRNSVGVIKVVAAYHEKNKVHTEIADSQTLWEKVIGKDNLSWQSLFSITAESGGLTEQA